MPPGCIPPSHRCRCVAAAQAQLQSQHAAELAATTTALQSELASREAAHSELIAEKTDEVEMVEEFRVGLEEQHATQLEGLEQQLDAARVRTWLRSSGLCPSSDFWLDC